MLHKRQENTASFDMSEHVLKISQASNVLLRERQAAKLERRAERAAAGGAQRLPRAGPPDTEDLRLPGADVAPPPWLPAGSGVLPPALLAGACAPLSCLLQQSCCQGVLAGSMLASPRVQVSLMEAVIATYQT